MESLAERYLFYWTFPVLEHLSQPPLSMDASSSLSRKVLAGLPLSREQLPLGACEKAQNVVLICLAGLL